LHFQKKGRSAARERAQPQIGLDRVAVEPTNQPCRGALTLSRVTPGTLSAFTKSTPTGCPFGMTLPFDIPIASPPTPFAQPVCYIVVCRTCFCFGDSVPPFLLPRLSCRPTLRRTVPAAEAGAASDAGRSPLGAGAAAGEGVGVYSRPRSQTEAPGTQRPRSSTTTTESPMAEGRHSARRWPLRMRARLRRACEGEGKERGPSKDVK